MIIGISGKKEAGKSTVAKILQYLSLDDEVFSKTNEDIIADLEYEGFCALKSSWKIKKFADKLKDIVCITIGCTRKQLESHEFKNTPLGEDWKRWTVTHNKITRAFDSRDSAAYEVQKYNLPPESVKCEMLTPRRLMELIGNDCFRNIIHPDFWTRSTLKDYTPKKPKVMEGGELLDLRNSYRHDECDHCKQSYPDWIIDDTRYQNEAKGIKKLGGVLIRVEKEFKPDAGDIVDFKVFSDWTPCTYVKKEESGKHLGVGTDGFRYSSTKIRLSGRPKSEICLDDYDKWDFVIDNNGTLDDLIDKVRDISSKITNHR